MIVSRKWFTVHRLILVFMAIIIFSLGILSILNITFPSNEPNDRVRLEDGSYYRYAPLSLALPMGTDNGGYDIFSRIYYGLRTNLVFSLLAGITFLFFGTYFGVGLGFYINSNNDFKRFLRGNGTSRSFKFTSILRILNYNTAGNRFLAAFINVSNSFPILLAVLLLRVILDGFIRSSNIKLAISMIFFGFISSPRLANMIIGKIKRLRAEEFIHSAIVLGLSNKTIIFKHILWYECRFIILYQVAYIMGQATILEVTLKYFGYGANNPWISWGLILDNMYKFSSLHIYLLFPIIFITMVIYFWMGLAEELKMAGEKREVTI